MAHAAPAAHEAAGAHGAGHASTSTGLSNAKLGMWAFLGSECLLFGALISSYILYRGRAVPGTKVPHDVYDIPYTSVSSFVLLMSSLTMVLALAAIQRGEQEKLRAWLMATALLGMTFVAGQVYEFTAFVKEGLSIKSNAATSAFFTLTGFHGAHVTIGILMLLSLFGMSLDGRLPTARSEVVELVGLYWHFVDIVWIVIFTVVYLIPREVTVEAGETTQDAAVAIEPEAMGREPELASHPGPREYIVVAVVLAVLTALEVAVYYISSLPHPLLVALLSFFAFWKFVLVVLWFMHLRFDSRIFRRLFVTGVVLAFAVYLIVLFTFKVFVRG